MAADDIPTLEKFTVGDTRAFIYATLVDRDGVAIPLTGMTVTLEGRRRGASDAFTPLAVTVTDAVEASVEVNVAAQMTGARGEYRCQFRVTDGATLFYRSDPFKIPVEEAASSGLL